jgi:predicted GNAT family acetyltransferase
LAEDTISVISPVRWFNAGAAHEDAKGDCVIEVIDNPEQSQYEVRLDGQQVGFAAYNRSGNDEVLLPHVEVRTEFHRQGIGSALAKGALDDIRSQGLRAVPLCPFIVDYVARHPEYQNLVTPL